MIKRISQAVRDVGADNQRPVAKFGGSNRSRRRGGRLADATFAKVKYQAHGTSCARWNWSGGARPRVQGLTSAALEIPTTAASSSPN
jgi:hypothetical protein